MSTCSSCTSAPSQVASAAQAASAEPAKLAEKAAAVDPGPATKVSISDDARAQLHAAGVAAADIATINLKDASAVSHAVHQARAHHSGGHHHHPPSVASAPNGTK
jgi:hypothetical protein